MHLCISSSLGVNWVFACHMVFRFSVVWKWVVFSGVVNNYLQFLLIVCYCFVFKLLGNNGSGKWSPSPLIKEHALIIEPHGLNYSLITVCGMSITLMSWIVEHIKIEEHLVKCTEIFFSKTPILHYIHCNKLKKTSQIARFLGPTWGPI